jgi:hypothetical protein
MKSSRSSKSNKLQRKRSAAADTAVVGVEIAATVVAAGVKVVVVGEEEVAARHHRRESGARDLLCFSRNDHKHYDTPGFSACDDAIGAKSSFCSGRQGHVSLLLVGSFG